MSSLAASFAPPPPDETPRTQKSRAAFRTISEVADDLDVAQHVLRFWESKFPQVRPLKRGGGRRYYRPEDIELLRQIRKLLYDEGYTIKGAQKLLRARRAPRQDEPVPAVRTEAPDREALPREAGPRAPLRALSIAIRRELDIVHEQLVELRERLHQALADDELA